MDDTLLALVITSVQLLSVLWTNIPRFGNLFTLIWSNRQAGITITSGWPHYTRILRWVAEHNDTQLLFDEYSEEMSRLQEHQSTNERYVQSTDGYWVSGDQAIRVRARETAAEVLGGVLIWG